MILVAWDGTKKCWRSIKNVGRILATLALQLSCQKRANSVRVKSLSRLRIVQGFVTSFHGSYVLHVSVLKNWLSFRVAIAFCVDCFDPLEFTEEDDVEDVDNGDGFLVRVRREWLKPPVNRRCGCQQGEVVQPCNCGLGAQPQGVCSRLFWDKVNNQNR